MEITWGIIIVNLVIPFLGSCLGAWIAFDSYKNKLKWIKKYDALNDALIHLERLKYISRQQSLINEEITDVPLPSEMKSPDYLRSLIFQVIEKLIPLKILFSTELSSEIDLYEQIINEHFETKHWDYENSNYTFDEQHNLSEEQSIYCEHCSRICQSTSKLIKSVLVHAKLN